MIDEPYNFDGNLILAWSNAFSVKKGYNTAGSTINNQASTNVLFANGETEYDLDTQLKFKSPQMSEIDRSKFNGNNYLSESEYRHSSKKK